MAVPTFSNQGASTTPDFSTSTDLSSYPSGSWTPPSSGLIILDVFSRISAGTPTIPTVSGNGIAWVQIATATISQIRLTRFGANASGSSTGATTVDFGGVTQIGCMGSFFTSPDAELAGGVAAAFVQSVTNTGTGTSGSVTLAAASHADNRPIAGFAHSANEVTTHQTNWTELDDLAGSSPVRGMNTQYRTSAYDTAAGASWSTSANWVGIASEIKGASAGGGAVTWSWDLEAYISAAWVSIVADVKTHDHPVVASRGISGNSVTARVASPGILTAMLDNSVSNSAGLDGYYTLNHANKRANFGRDTRVRLKLVRGATTKYLWHGLITDLEPTAGRYLQRESFMTAVDFMQKMVKHKLDAIPIQENKRSDQIMQTILSNMAAGPLNTTMDTDVYALDLALHSENDEKSTAMSAAQKLCQTCLYYAFVKGNATDGETFVFQRELSRMTNTPGVTLDNTMSELKFPSNSDRVFNKVIGSIFPSEVDQGADTLLASLASEFPLDAGDTQTINLRFRDPSGGAQRISGKDIVTTLVADTHYKMSAFEDSGENDMNGSLGVVVTAGGNAVNVAVTNNGGVRGYINKIEIYGNGIYLYDPIDIIVESGAADKTLTYDLYYLDDPYRATGFLTLIHRRASSGSLEVESVVFRADANDTLMGYAINNDIGDRVLLQEYMTGLNDEYTINQVTYTFDQKGNLLVEWGLEYAEVYNFFTLDDPVLGILDNASNVLAPM